MSAPRAVICDFGGVLTTPLLEAFIAYQNHSGIPFEKLGMALQAELQETGRHPLYELEIGAISEAEFIATLESRLDGARLHGFREVYFEHVDRNEPMIELMRRLREDGMRMALLTNNVREWEPLWRPKLPEIDEVFEVVVDSAFVGMRKPDPAIYELTVERLGGVAAEDCLFVDDTELNCEAARALGMRAVHFRENEQAIPEIEAVLAQK